MSTKQFALAGVNETVEFGKDGHKVDASNSGYFKLTDSSDTLIRVKGLAANASDEFVTKTQLDAVNALAGGYTSYSYDASGNISQLSGQGTGDSGAILYGDTYKIGTSGTFLGQSAQAGDLVSALVAGADVSDNTSSNTDWILIEIRTASDLADGSSTDHSSGKIIVKDRGIDGSKIALETILNENMGANSIDSDQYVDRSIDGVHIGLAQLLDEHHATNQIAKNKLAASVQTTLTNADTQYGTRNGNFESAIGGSFDADSDSSIAAQTNYGTDTTITGQLSQLDARMKLDNDDNALRVVSASHSGGAQNIGSSVKSGRTVLRVKVKPVTVANGANCTMTIGVSGDAAKYVAAADIDLYESTVQVFEFADELSSDEQIIATVTQGTATQGTFYVTVEHA